MYKYESEKLKCNICGRALHNNGKVIIVNDGRYGLVGDDCGRHYFLGWDAHKQNFDDARKRQIARSRALQLLNEKNEIIERIVALREPFSALETERRKFKKIIGQEALARLSIDLDKGSGELFLTRKIDKAIKGIFGAGGAMGDYVSESLGRVDGWKFYSMQDFRKRIDCHISGAMNSIDSVEVAFEKGRSPIGSLKSFNSNMVEISREIEIYQSSIRYVDFRSLDAISRWLEENNLSKISVILRNGQINVDYRDEKLGIEQSAVITPSPFPYIDQLMYAF